MIRLGTPLPLGSGGGRWQFDHFGNRDRIFGGPLHLDRQSRNIKLLKFDPVFPASVSDLPDLFSGIIQSGEQRRVVIHRDSLFPQMRSNEAVQRFYLCGMQKAGLDFQTLGIDDDQPVEITQFSCHRAGEGLRAIVEFETAQPVSGHMVDILQQLPSLFRLVTDLVLMSQLVEGLAMRQVFVALARKPIHLYWQLLE